MKKKQNALDKIPVRRGSNQVNHQTDWSLKFVSPPLKEDEKLDLKWDSEYLRMIKQALNPLKDKSYMPPNFPTSLTNNNKLLQSQYFCNECHDCFQFSSSFDDHMSRRSWVLGYSCPACLPSNDSTQTKKLRTVQLFYNQCQFLAHLRKHNLTTLNIRQIMLMPVPNGLEECDINQFKEICAIMMDYLFEKGIHIMDWLGNENSNSKWWRASELDMNPVGELLKRANSMRKKLESSFDDCKSTDLRMNTVTPFFSEQPLLSLINKEQNVTKNKTVMLWEDFLAGEEKKNQKKYRVMSLKNQSSKIPVTKDSHGNNNEIKLSAILSQLSPELKRNNEIILINNKKMNPQQENKLRGQDNSEIYQSDLFQLDIIDTNFIEHWKLFDKNGEMIPNGTWNLKQDDELELLSPKIKSDGNLYLIKKRLKIKADEKKYMKPQHTYSPERLKELIEKHQTTMIAQFVSNRNKRKVQAIINDIQQTSSNFLKSNLIGDEIVLSNNLIAMKTFNIYSKDEADDDLSILYDDCEAIINDEFDRKEKEWEYNFDGDSMKSLDSCTKCKRKIKPTCYRLGISKPASNESLFCQCDNYICHLCNSRQGNTHRYQAHLRFHKQDKPFSCPDCKHEFESTNQLEQHIWTKCFHVMRQVVFSCRLCNIEGFLTMEDLTRHYANVHTKTAIICKCCLQLFNTYAQFLRHYNIKHKLSSELFSNPERLIVCEFGQCIVTSDNFHRHLETHPEIGHITYYTCPFCSFIVRNIQEHEELIKNHIFQSHSNKLPLVITPESLKIFGKKLHINIDETTEEIEQQSITNKKNIALPNMEKTLELQTSCVPALISKTSNGKNKIKKKIDKTRRVTKPLRIALNGPTNFLLNFNCHLCGELINTKWLTIKTHFDQNHTDDYKLSNVYVRLIKNAINKYEDESNDSLDKKKRKIEICDNSSSPKRKQNVQKNKESEESLSLSSLDFYVHQDPLKKVEGTFQCKKCCVKFEDNDKIRSHMANDHRIKKHYWICLECGENFVVETSLKMHLKVFHGIQNPTAYMSENSICTPNAVNFEVIEKSSQSNRCYVCMAVFEDKAAVDKHLRVHGMAFLNKKKFEAQRAKECSVKLLKCSSNGSTMSMINSNDNSNDDDNDNANGLTPISAILL